MFVTGPVPAAGSGNQMRVHNAVGRTFDELTGQTLNPTLRGYVADMTASYGLAVREDLLDQGAGHSYGEMCAPLLDELVSEERPADLLVLATGIPDVRFGRSTSVYLSWHCAGAPLAFTVCDQGSLSAFTALHLIQGYARSGDCRRAVLMVAEQPTLYHELPVPTVLPDRAAAVGVVLETTGSQDALSLHRHTKVAEDQVAGVLAAEISLLPAGASVLLGADLAALVSGQPFAADVWTCRDNQPSTGIWLELAGRIQALGDSEGQVMLAEYDPALGYLFTATMRIGG
jgi:hypothetical protein